MCCFTELVERVSDTSIFARAVDGRQILAYEMTYAAQSELAMVLPLPVPPGSPEDALRFISLEACPDFFEQLRDGFPRLSGTDLSLGGGEARATDIGMTLDVVEVGSFEASFVPRPEDFARLDERFRLPADLWLKLNFYRDWGFAVFKLKRAAEGLRVHPMAFEFPRRDRSRLFFPTLHIHHRSVDPEALFDHDLYCQPEPAMNWHLQGWAESYAAVRRFMRCKEGLALFEPDAPVWRLEIGGLRENADTWLGRGGRIPAEMAA